MSKPFEFFKPEDFAEAFNDAYDKGNFNIAICITYASNVANRLLNEKCIPIGQEKSDEHREIWTEGVYDCDDRESLMLPPRPIEREVECDHIHAVRHEDIKTGDLQKWGCKFCHQCGEKL